MAEGSTFAVVVIARNEGERLKRCLLSIPTGVPIVYVDSGSTDGSIAWAARSGIDVVELDMLRPFTAARARNVGFARLMQRASDLTYVQFIDGDCELTAGWTHRATNWLNQNPRVCAVFGRRRERHPERSIYNFLSDVEWNVPIGEAKAFGGDVMLRTSAFRACNGYRDSLIAGEEPELAVRLRAAGWTIFRLDAEMTLHDANMLDFRQWWQRMRRSGHAFAEGAALHGKSPERHWVRESRRAILWGGCLPLFCIVMMIATSQFGEWGAASWLIFPAQMLRLIARSPIQPFRARCLIAVFQVIGRFPEAHGWLEFRIRRWRGIESKLIEYKRNAV